MQSIETESLSSFDDNNNNNIDNDGTAIGQSTLSSVRHEQWFRKRWKHVVLLSSIAVLVDITSGAVWVWGLNGLAWSSGMMMIPALGGCDERIAAATGALSACAAGAVQTAAGITRLTTMYDGFWWCRRPDDYSCYTWTGCASLPAAVLWFGVMLLWMHAMARIFRPSVWIRWNPKAPIWFLTGIACLLELLGGGFWGWPVDIFCVVLLVCAEQRCCSTASRADQDDTDDNAADSQWCYYVAAAFLALAAAVIQGGHALQAMFDDRHSYGYCDYMTSRVHFNCADDMEAVCLAGACVWVLVAGLSVRHAIRIYASSTGEIEATVPVDESTEYGLIAVGEHISDEAEV